MKKKIYEKPTMEAVQLNIHQPMLTMSLTDTESSIQFSRELDPFLDDLDILLPTDFSSDITP
jgi:hypothetical protein